MLKFLKEIPLSTRSISLSTSNRFELFLFLEKFFQNLFNISVLSLHRMILVIFSWKNFKISQGNSIIDSIDFFIDFKSIRTIPVPRQIFPKLTQYFRPFPASCDIIYFLVEKF